MDVALVWAGADAPPFGLMSIASVLEEHGYEVMIADFTREEITESNFKQKIKEEPLVVGFSSYSTPMIARAIKLTEIAKEVCPNSFKIWGGVHATLFPKQVLSELQINAVAIHEGEYTTLELIEALKRNFSPNKVKGLWLKEKGALFSGFIFTGVRPSIMDMEKLPPYPWHLIDMQKYLRSLPLGRKKITLVESRGCPFDCSFCYVQVMFGPWRGKSVENVLEDFKFLRSEYGVERVDLLDDLPFGGSKKRMLQFCEKMKDTGVDSWTCDHRVNLVDRQMLSTMKEAGCEDIYFGVESGSPRILKLLNRVGITLESTIKAFKLCFEIGIRTFAGFMVGLPTETIEDLKLSLALAKRILATHCRAVNYVPYAGTKLYELAKEHGFQEPKRLIDWATVGDYTRSRSNFSYVNDDVLTSYKRAIENVTYKNALKFAHKHKDVRAIIPALRTFMLQHEKLRWLRG